MAQQNRGNNSGQMAIRLVILFGLCCPVDKQPGDVYPGLYIHQLGLVDAPAELNALLGILYCLIDGGPVRINSGTPLPAFP